MGISAHENTSPMIYPHYTIWYNPSHLIIIITADFSQDNDSKFGTLVAMKKPRLLEHLGFSQRSQRWCRTRVFTTVWFFPTWMMQPYAAPNHTSWFVPLGGCPRFFRFFRFFLAWVSWDPIAPSPFRWAGRCEIWVAAVYDDGDDGRWWWCGFTSCFGGTKCETPKGVLVFVEYVFCSRWQCLDLWVWNSVEIETMQARPWKCWVWM